MRRKLPWYVLVFLSVSLFFVLALEVAKPRLYTGTSILISANVKKMVIEGDGVQIEIGADHYFALQKDQLPPVTGKSTAKPLGFKVDQYYTLEQQPISAGTWVALVPGVLDIQLTSETAMTVKVHRVSSAIADDVSLVAGFVFLISFVVGVWLYIAQQKEQRS